ncbi:hypothetical protein HK096_004819, partial [Nowakowskiella sp. JEL0078]
MAFSESDDPTNDASLTILQNELFQCMWLYIGSSLISLKNWAKQNTGSKEAIVDIIMIVYQMFAFATPILHKIVGNKGKTPEFIDLHMLAALNASAAWMNSLDEKIRGEAVDVVELFINVLICARLQSDHCTATLNRVTDLCQSKPTLLISDDQCLRIVTAVSRYESIVLATENTSAANFDSGIDFDDFSLMSQEEMLLIAEQMDVSQNDINELKMIVEEEKKTDILESN